MYVMVLRLFLAIVKCEFGSRCIKTDSLSPLRRRTKLFNVMYSWQCFLHVTVDVAMLPRFDLK